MTRVKVLFLSFQEAANRASWLWLSSREASIGFLIALTASVCLLLAIEYRGVWRLIAVDRAQQLLAGDPGFKHRRERDFVFKTVLADLARLEQTTGDVVVLLGGSTVREFVPDDAFLSEELSRKCGRPIRFFNAGSGSQVFAETWSLAGLVPSDRLTLVLVGINFNRFTDDD